MLTDLGGLIATPELSLVPRVRAELATAAVGTPRRLSRFALVAAATIVVALIATLSIAPARDAVARFLGIGSTTVEPVDKLPPAQTRGALPGSGDTGRLFERLHEAGLSVPDAALVGSPLSWRVDLKGETTVAFADVVLSQRRGAEPVGKLTPRPNGAEFVNVGNDFGIWVPGEHVRQVDGRNFSSSSALVWVHNGVELHLEGDLPLARMLTIARSMHPARVALGTTAWEG